VGNGLWIGTSGGGAALRALDIAANNLANSQTTGFKADLAVFSVQAALNPPVDQSLSAALSAASTGLVASATDFSAGTSIPTDSPTDFAVDGEGFFHLRDAGGREFLTRDGTFQLDGEGRLSTRDGLLVLSESGEPLTVAGGTLTVAPDGRVTVDGDEVGRIALKDVIDRSRLVKVGGTRFEFEGPLLEGMGEVAQGRLEGSNVQPVSALVELIALQRYYEAFQKTAQATDDMDKQLAQRVGRKTD
jgi:flagellar basal body rod protein FlgG